MNILEQIKTEEGKFKMNEKKIQNEKIKFEYSYWKSK